METKRIRVAIIGGGIGGLTLALSIAKLVPDYESHLEVDIYESTSSLQAQVGAGIGVWPNVWSIMEKLGVDQKLLKHTTTAVTEDPVEPLLLRKADQPEGRDLFKMRTTCGSIIAFHRGDFQAVLLNSIPPQIKIHTNKRLSSYTQDDTGVELHFEDGTSAFATLVVGADGLQSRTRKTLVQERSQGNLSPDVDHANPHWTGLVTYRTLIPRQRIIDAGWPNHRSLSSWTVHSGQNAALMTYPVSNGEQVNFVGFRIWSEYEGKSFSHEIMEKILEKEGYKREQEGTLCARANGQDAGAPNERDPWAENGGGGQSGTNRGRWVSRVDPAEVRNSYLGWEPEVQVLFECFESALAWAVHKVGPLKSFIGGNVCLIGDAAHAMQPQHGTGAGQGILDAYMLARLLATAVSADPSKLRSRLGAVLETYDNVRRKNTENVAAAARACGFYYYQRVQDGDGDDSWRQIDTSKDEEVRLLQERLTDGWSYAWDKSAVEIDVQEAVKMLHERLSIP